MAISRLAAATRNAMLQAIVTRLDLGAGPATMKIYSGPMPPTGDTALSGNTLLGTLTFSKPAAPAPADGTLAFATITEDSSADASDKATFARLQDSNGGLVGDFDVGDEKSDAVIKLNSTNIAEGGPIRITAFTISLPASIG